MKKSQLFLKQRLYCSENTANLQAIEAGNYVMMNTWNNDQEIAGLYAYDSMSVISEKLITVFIA